MDYDKKDEDVTVQGRDTPVPVRSLSERAGSPGPSASDRSAPPVEGQAGGGILATGVNEEDTRETAREVDQARKTEDTDTDTDTTRKDLDEVARTKMFMQKVLDRRKLWLSTQGLATHSAPTSPGSTASDSEFAWDDEERRSSKRRREETRSKQKENTESGGATEVATKLCKIIEGIHKEVGMVYELAKERNTKREIKTTTNSLKRLVSQLQTSEVQALLQSLGRRQAGDETEDHVLGQKNQNLEEQNWKLRTENDSLRGEIMKLATKGAEGETILDLKEENRKLRMENDKLRGEILELTENGDKGEMKQELFGEPNNYEQFSKAATLVWPDKVFDAAFYSAGSLTQANRGTDLLVLQEEGQGANEEIRKELMERYPDLREIESKVGAISVTTRKIDANEAEAYDKWVFRIEVDDDEKEFFDSLIRMKELMQKGGRTKVAIYPPGWDATAEKTKKMLEWIFRHSGMKCLIHARRQEGDSMQTGRKRADAIIIRQEGKGYAETLRTIKEQVKPGTMGAKVIRTIRETKDGSVLMVLQNGNDKSAEELRRKLKGSGDIRIVKDINSNCTTLFLSEIDGVTTREEVTEVLCRETGLSEDQVQVGELRKSYGGNQMTTVNMTREKAEMLVKREGLRIGLSWCPIKERVDPVKCFRCWQYGHIGRNCRAETDASKLCRKCGEEGHFARECDKEDKCLTCKKPGHTAGSGKCPEFRKAIARERLVRRRRNRY